ncbi:solute carrier family 23 protein, partial [Oleiphilus sp. HI0067]|uniref:solute carrier family 23 protein n=1 Tax=Oleiphilus sp. HI0067 TaxID=1822243 RepID=UPI00351640A6
MKVEIVAGLTTFLTMSYILFANPDIMSAAGMPKEAVFTATAVAAAVGCILMGLWANFPAGLAPGMGLNAFFAFAVVGGMGYTWEQALAAVLISGVIFFLLSAFKIREWILHSIPGCLRHGITVGIGLFLTIIGLKNAGIIADHPATLLTLGDLASPGPLLAGLGLLLIIALDYRKITGSIVVSMLAISIVSSILGITTFSGIVGEPHSMSELFFALDFSRVLEA